MNQSPSAFDSDLHSLSALVHFMVLEKLDMISPEDGNATVLSNLLRLRINYYLNSSYLKVKIS